MALRNVLLLVLATSVLGTQVMHRPSGYKQAPPEVDTDENARIHHIERRATGKASVAYFTNWGIYAAGNFQPTDIVPSTVTHILYSFADVSPDTGVISLTDSYADQEKHFPNDSWSETGNNLYGCLKQMYLLKMNNRNLKVLLSIGGWTYSQSGHFNFVTSASSRATFVTSAVRLIEDYGFDGVDLDFEYPSTSAQGQGFADLFTALRTAFKNLASSKGDTSPYLLSAAVAAGANNYANLKIPQMNAALDYWNLMAYDYAGSWLTTADHQANLYGGTRTGVSTDAAVKYYVGAGATASKITMGIPLYGRSFEGTDGIGQSFTGVGVDEGTYAYKVLPLSGSQVFENSTDVTSYSYDSSKRELVSYDTPNIVRTKMAYIKSQGLGGAMYWEMSKDKAGSDSLAALGAGLLAPMDSTENHLNYPSSKWDNIRNQMGGSTPPTSTTTSAGSGGTSPGGSCGSVGAWASSTVYVGGSQVSYGGALWTAKWWTQGDTPGGAADVWTRVSAC